jgi:hypothetical protein
LNGVFDESGEDWQAKPLGNWSSGKEDCSSTIGNLRGVSGSGGSVLLEGSLELLKSLKSGLLSDSVILADGDLLSLVSILNKGLDGNDFILEETLLLG